MGPSRPNRVPSARGCRNTSVAPSRKGLFHSGDWGTDAESTLRMPVGIVRQEYSDSLASAGPGLRAGQIHARRPALDPSLARLSEYLRRVFTRGTFPLRRPGYERRKDPQNTCRNSQTGVFRQPVALRALFSTENRAQSVKNCHSTRRAGQISGLFENTTVLYTPL